MNRKHNEMKASDLWATRVGAYGVWQRSGRVLLVKKTKGPYAGSWDLPGGGIESGETPIVTLKREFLEEVAATITTATWIAADSAKSRYVNEDAVAEQFFHVWLLYRVRARASVHISVASDDTAGAHWFGLEELGGLDVSPLVESAIAYLPELDRGLS